MGTSDVTSIAAAIAYLICFPRTSASTVGPDHIPMSWSHVPSLASLSYTSKILKTYRCMIWVGTISYVYIMCIYIYMFAYALSLSLSLSLYLHIYIYMHIYIDCTRLPRFILQKHSESGMRTVSIRIGGAATSGP